MTRPSGGGQDGGRASLANAPNFRDFGAHPTRDGRRVRPGMLFRSGQLHRLTAQECAAIEELGIELVIDLRQDSERARAPSPRWNGLRVVACDVLAGSESDVDGITAEGWQQIAAGAGFDYMLSLYQRLVTAPAARDAYSLVLATVAGATGPVLIHCAAGQDRTGWAAAVILAALGVERDAVVADYLLSAAMLDAKHRRALPRYAARLEGRGIREEHLVPLLWARPEYLAAAIEEVERRHGSFDAYLVDGLGVEPGLRAALRDRLISPAGAVP